MSNSLSQITAARKALMQAESFSDVLKIADTAKALREYVRRADEGKAAQNAAARIHVEALRRAGQMLIESAESGERETWGGDRKSKSHGATLKIEDIGITKSDSSRWQKLAKIDANEFASVCSEIEDEGGEITQAGIIRKANGAHVGKNSGQNEWYTPQPYIDAARAVMGGIDVDPASNDIAQERVGANVYYTEETNGLDKAWKGSVWMNPPYESALIGLFAGKLVEEFTSGNTRAAIVLVNNATETKWFQMMAEICSAICFPSSRIRFLDPDGNTGSAPLQGQAVIYLGDDPSGFCKHFTSFGFVLRRGT